MIANDRGTLADYIVLEFNELCPQFMEDFISQGLLPNFKRLRDSSIVMVTDADERAPQLEPWVQWVTIHSGLKADEHKVFDLGEGSRLQQPEVATILGDQDIPVGILGSMNTNYQGLNGFFIPDPWDLEGKAEPADLQPFYSTVANQVQNSSTEEGLSKKDLMEFGWFMFRHGMRASTVSSGIRQIWNERKDSGVQWRRSMILERIQFDLFRHLKGKFKTRFNTFFCNSTAHFQHYYWRNMEPDIFVVPPDKADHPSLQNAILEGYKNMDSLVGKFMQHFPSSKLILLTALSQQPWRETTKCTFRPVDFDRFLQFVRIDPQTVEVKPVMAEQFHIVCKSSEQQTEVMERLLHATVNQQPVMEVRREDFGVFCGCPINDVSVLDCEVVHPTGDRVAFGELFNMVHSMRSGWHHPHGLFWLQSETPRVVDTPIELVDVAPTLLDLYGVEPPSFMTGRPISQ